MEPNTATVTRLLGRLYDAAASPERWPEFLLDFQEVGKADMAYVLAVSADSRSDLSIQLGFDDAAIDSYHRYFVTRDPILDGFMGAVAEHGDWIGTSETVVATSRLRHSELFNDFMQPLGMAHHCGATLSGLEEGMTAGICMMRSDGAGAFDSEAIALLAILEPHVKRALALHKTLQTARMEGALLRQSVETVDLAIISVDGDGEILNITQAARNIIERRDGLELERKQLRASNSAEQDRLSDLMSGAVSTGSGSRQWRTVRCSRTTAPQAGRSALWTPASGTGSDSGTIAGTHPPIASGTYTGSYSDSGITYSASLSINATKDSSDAGYTLSGTATVSGLSFCGAPTSYTFAGSQSGAEITGYLISGGQEWIQISGSTDASGATLTGGATMTSGICAGFGGSGSIVNSSIQDTTTASNTNDLGSITINVKNYGNGTGVVSINGTPVSCPVTPGYAVGVDVINTAPYVSCGTITLPAGTSSIQIFATADQGMQLGGEWDDCPTAGSSTVVFAGGCTRTLYNIPSGNITSTAIYSFGVCTGNECSDNPF